MLESWFPYALLLAVVAAAAVMDLRTGKVFNALTYPAILVGLLYWAVVGQVQHQGSWAFLQAAGVGALAGLVPMAALVLMGGLGGGDMKLMGAVGAITASWHAVLNTGINALLIAAAIAIVIMVRRGMVKQTFSRLLGAAMMASARVKPEFPPPHEKAGEGQGELPGELPGGATVPFAAAVAVGAAIAGAELFLDWTPPWGSW